MGTLKDELFKHFNTAGLPDSGDPHLNQTTGARVNTGIRTAPFPPTATEYKQPPTTLPTQVSQSEILAHNKKRGNTPWSSEGGE
jgi:hypothetical protein